MDQTQGNDGTASTLQVAIADVLFNTGVSVMAGALLTKASSRLSR